MRSGYSLTTYWGRVKGLVWIPHLFTSKMSRSASVEASMELGERVYVLYINADFQGGHSPGFDV